MQYPAPGARTSFRIVFPPLVSRQGASAFNQPLSFNTSSVIDMNYMFSVRGLPPPSAVGAFRARSLRRCHAPPSHLPAHKPRHASYVPSSALQRASTFNQPLTLDTSSVTDMNWMFYVRSSHAPPLVCSLGPPLVSRPAPLVANRMPSFRLGSTQGRSTSR